MPRARWSLVIVALLALPLVSCFDGESKCSTCPPDRSGKIGFFLPGFFDLDSARVGLNGPAVQLIRRGQGGQFTELAKGTYTFNAIIYRNDINGLPHGQSVSLQIVLDRGETRTVVFHHDFPVVVWAPEAAPRAGETRIVAAPLPTPGRVG